MRSGKSLFSFVSFGPLVSALLFFPLVSLAQSAPTSEEALNFRLNPHSLDQHRTELGVTDLRRQVLQVMQEGRRKRVSVAILDKGFAGWRERRGVTIPKRTIHIPGPIPMKETTAHGSLMAEMVTSIVQGAEREGTLNAPPPFELRLYNVAGFSNFKAAIDDLIKNKVDLVLYSEVWEIGGNFDGKGFINYQVLRAAKAGVIWINAAGNFNGRVYNAPIRIGQNDLVDLPDARSSLEIECRPEGGMEFCPTKITLAWNDFKNNPALGTEKDLDLALFDENFKVVKTSLKKQVDIEGEAQEEQSKYPREALTAELKPGVYHVWVRSRQRNWGRDDRLRILVDGDGLIVPQGDEEESLQNPADNVAVITVGATDSERSSVSRRLNKPELLAPSNVQEYYGRQFRGSSNAAALMMGKAILLKYLDPSLDRIGMIEALDIGARPEQASR